MTKNRIQEELNQLDVFLTKTDIDPDFRVMLTRMRELLITAQQEYQRGIDDFRENLIRFAWDKRNEKSRSISKNFFSSRGLSQDVAQRELETAEFVYDTVRQYVQETVRKLKQQDV